MNLSLKEMEQPLDLRKQKICLENQSNYAREEIKRMEEKIREEFQRIQEMANQWKDIADQKENQREKIIFNEKTSCDKSFQSFENSGEKTVNEENFPVLKKMLESPDIKKDETCEKEHYPLLKKGLLEKYYPNTKFEKISSSVERSYPTLKKRLLEESITLKDEEKKYTEKNVSILPKKDGDQMPQDDKVVFQTIKDVIPENKCLFKTIDIIERQKCLESAIPESTENKQENIEEKMEYEVEKDEENNVENVQTCLENQIASEVNYPKKCTRKISKRQVGFGYIALYQNKNGQVNKFTLATFSETVTVKNCEKMFFEKLECLMIKFNLTTVYILKEDNAKLKKSRPYLIPFKLNKKCLKCVKCNKTSCTVGRVAYYFETFHRVTYNECEYKI